MTNNTESRYSNALDFIDKLYTAQENDGAKSVFHKRNKYMGLLSPVGAIGNHFTKSGRDRIKLIKKSKTTNLTEGEKQELRKLNHVRSNSGVGALGGFIVPVLGHAVGAKIMRNEVHKRSVDSYNDEDTFDGGTGAGSPGVSSVGNMGGNTNKGLSPLKKNYHEDVKEYVKHKLANPGYK